MFCSYCGQKLPDDVLFCTSCGMKLPSASSQTSSPINMVQRGNISVAAHTIVVSRAVQFICAGCTYKVFVNGQNLGHVGVGKSVSMQFFSDAVDVDICCTTVWMSGCQLHLTLKPLQNPRVDFKLEYGGSIHATVGGAEILAQRSGK